MSCVSPPSSVRWNDLLHPVIAGLISVIVNYGGTFILVFQAAHALLNGRWPARASASLPKEAN